MKETNYCATCPRCGKVPITPEQISLTVVQNDEGEMIEEKSKYCFSCPKCNSDIDKPVDKSAAKLLTMRGCMTTVISGLHPEYPPEGFPPLTWDDLIELHFILEAEDWFSQLLAHEEE